MSDSIYKISNEINNLKRMLMDDEIDEQMYLDTMECMKMSVEEKAGAVAYVNREVKAAIEQAKEQKKYIDFKKSMWEARLKKLNERTMQLMKAADIKKCESGIFQISIQKNGGLQELDYDEQNVPDNYLKIKYEVDTEKIRKDLDAGKELSFARLLPRTEGLRFR